jgi:hypothetical protein
MAHIGVYAFEGAVLFDSKWRLMLCFARACAWQKTLLGIFLLFAGEFALANVPQVPDWTREKVVSGSAKVLGGSFMSVDPVLTDNNTGASFNRYVYANNSPYKYIDPDGRIAFLALVPIALKIIDISITALEVYSAAQTGGASAVAVVAAESAAASVVPGGKTVNAVRKYVAGGTFSKATKEIAKNRAKSKCEYCGTKTVPAKQSESGVTPPGNEGVTDHIDPKSNGGMNSPDNAAHACRDCNGALSNNPKPHPRESEVEAPKQKTPEE